MLESTQLNETKTEQDKVREKKEAPLVIPMLKNPLSKKFKPF